MPQILDKLAQQSRDGTRTYRQPQDNATRATLPTAVLGDNGRPRPTWPASKTNDLDLADWKKYDDILTDSLWILKERDSSSVHNGKYHGNFIPQIPNQLIRRFTKEDDIVLDPFMGSGTTAIEATRLNRRYIGVELVPQVAERTRGLIRETGYPPAYDNAGVITGDSSNAKTAKQIGRQLKEMNSGEQGNVQLLLLHPPYHNIIQFSKQEADLSNCYDVDHFVERFMQVYHNLIKFLEPGRHLAVVIGDIYQNSEWVPLQSLLTMQLLATSQLRLKSVIVKNMLNNRAKRNQGNLWRYRALANGFYIFKHEYIALFQKLDAKGGAA